MSNILELKDVSKEYAQGDNVLNILNKVNLKVSQGEVISIIGASGSGKSTLLHIAGLLDSQYSGQLVIDAQSIESKKQYDQIRLEKLGFIYQYHHLVSALNARENVAMPLVLAGLSQKDALMKADNVLAKLELRDRTYNYPGELSGGQQQRVAIARAMINNPKLLLADEPTGNLDDKTSEIVLELFLQAARRQQIATIFVTHNMQIAKKMDKIYELKYGELKQVG